MSLSRPLILSFFLQKKRKQRMLGGSESDEDGDESDEDEEESRRQQKKKRREISGDDLGENFVVENEYQEKGWVDEVLARREDSDEDDEDDDNEDDEGLSDESEGDEDEEDSDEDGSEESEDEDWEHSEDELEGIEGIPKLSAKDQDLLDKLLAAKKGPKPEEEVRNLLEKDKKIPQKAKKSPSDVHELDGALPYVIDAPQTLLEFRELVDKRSIQDLEIAVERIRKCNAVSLAAENRKKMQVCSFSLKLIIPLWLPPCFKCLSDQ